MHLSFALPSIPTRSLRAMLLLFVIFYLCFHAISGERGILAWFKAQNRLSAIETELEEARDTRKTIAKRVDLLSGSEIDHDMLDEQARRVLGFARDNEVVVLQGQNASRNEK